MILYNYTKILIFPLAILALEDNSLCRDGIDTFVVHDTILISTLEQSQLVRKDALPQTKGCLAIYNGVSFNDTLQRVEISLGLRDEVIIIIRKVASSRYAVSFLYGGGLLDALPVHVDIQNVIIDSRVIPLYSSYDGWWYSVTNGTQDSQSTRFVNDLKNGCQVSLQLANGMWVYSSLDGVTKNIKYLE